MQAIDLPSRRAEAWRYSDLRSAASGLAVSGIVRDRNAPEVGAELARTGVAGALAVQMDRVQRLQIAPGERVVRFDVAAADAGLAPHMLQLHVGPGAALDRVVVQPQAIAGLALDVVHVTVEPGGVFRQFVLGEGARLARIETHIEAMSGAHVELRGVYLCDAGLHCDLTSVVAHKQDGAQTHQLIKGAVRKGGRGVFQGKIIVEREAQKTDARQYHHGMLLEEGAEIFAKPELMIYADDVQCAHGATTGGLDESALFYLRARGVPELEARALLTEAFLLDAVPDWMDASRRDEVLARIGAWLRSAS